LPAAAIATKIITAVRAVSTFIMENLLFTDVKIVLGATEAVWFRAAGV